MGNIERRLDEIRDNVEAEIQAKVDEAKAAVKDYEDILRAEMGKVSFWMKKNGKKVAIMVLTHLGALMAGVILSYLKL